MSQSAKRSASQGVSPTYRRGRAAAAGENALLAGMPAFARAGFSDPSLVLRWHVIAGSEIARIASPLKLQDGDGGAVLTLGCDPGAAVFLQHQTRALIERLNAYLGNGKIARVKFVPTRVDPLPEYPPHPRLRHTDSPIESENVTLSRALERLARMRAAAWDRRIARTRIEQ